MARDVRLARAALSLIEQVDKVREVLDDAARNGLGLARVADAMLDLSRARWGCEAALREGDYWDKDANLRAN
jgi:hypothetical protein